MGVQRAAKERPGRSRRRLGEQMAGNAFRLGVGRLEGGFSKAHPGIKQAVSAPLAASAMSEKSSRADLAEYYVVPSGSSACLWDALVVLQLCLGINHPSIARTAASSHSSASASGSRFDASHLFHPIPSYPTLLPMHCTPLSSHSTPQMTFPSLTKPPNTNSLSACLSISCKRNAKRITRSPTRAVNTRAHCSQTTHHERIDSLSRFTSPLDSPFWTCRQSLRGRVAGSSASTGPESAVQALELWKQTHVEHDTR
ncbi:hypothetical protein B0J11DRAFT_508901 [Dendryphion nanum]|uniref:Uncharacterized protein n=1 Tax=Dendryphion nanum TaxID=256645 RepID=A0A9P9IGT0_9PLEO|nr:hypothetical protein B0J11DRAFT_508901 [Dendryphion nanum]